MVAKEVPRPPRPRRQVRGSQTGRPIMAALDLLGRRWVLRLPWAPRDSPPGARVLRSRCDAMSSNAFYLCLRELETAGPVGRDGADCCLLTPIGRRPRGRDPVAGRLCPPMRPNVRLNGRRGGRVTDVILVRSCTRDGR